MPRVEDTPAEAAWYALSVDDVVARVGVDAERGLDADEVQRRLAEYGRERDRHRAATDAVGGRQGSAGEPDEHHAADRQHRQLRHRPGGDRRRSCWRWCRST